jgi:integration host factor subunit alpha
MLRFRLELTDKTRRRNKTFSGVQTMSITDKNNEKWFVSAPQLTRSATGEGVQRGTLTRQDIALAIYESVEGISRREAKRLTDCVIDEMVTTLVSGETLKLHDFGSFVVRNKQERSGRDPRTGEPVPIEARRVVVFKASPNMKAAVNGDAPSPRRAKGERRRETVVRGGDLPFAATAWDKP